MVEIKHEVKTFLVDMICDKCNEGKMEYTDGNILLTEPPQFKHTCSNCGHVETYFTRYPRTEYQYEIQKSK
jgi:RNase P subunit RPR2